MSLNNLPQISTETLNCHNPGFNFNGRNPDQPLKLSHRQFSDKSANLLNIFNGLVGLTFSCDGSHYMPWDEFLDKNLGFWLGTSGGEGIC